MSFPLNRQLTLPLEPSDEVPCNSLSREELPSLHRMICAAYATQDIQMQLDSLIKLRIFVSKSPSVFDYNSVIDAGLIPPLVKFLEGTNHKLQVGDPIYTYKCKSN